jgi:hypothetical protein
MLYSILTDGQAFGGEGSPDAAFGEILVAWQAKMKNAPNTFVRGAFLDWIMRSVN